MQAAEAVKLFSTKASRSSNGCCVVHYKVGGRSAQAYEVLKQAGYTRIKNLKGGILVWADQVDRSMQKY